MSSNRLYIRIRPFRFLGYLFWLGCMLVMYMMFRSFLLLFFTLFLIVFPIISIAAAFFPARKLMIDIRTQKAYTARTGDELLPVIEVRDPLYIGSSDAIIKIDVRNIFFSEEESELTMSLPVIAKKPWKKDAGYGISRLMIPLRAERIGDYSFTLRDVQISDLLGLIRIGIRNKKGADRAGGGSSGSSSMVFDKPVTADIPVLPRKGRGQMPDSESISSGLTEVEESTRTGNDFSEVTDIREYRPGDRIRDIHWKLSARQPERPEDVSGDDTGYSASDWMVKVRTQMAGMELSVVMVLDADDVTTERIMETTYGELRVWSEGETDIRFLVYNGLTFGFDEYTLSSPRDVDAAFEDILGVRYTMRLPADASADGIDGILRNLYPYMGGYIRFGVMEDGRTGWTGVDGVRV